MLEVISASWNHWPKYMYSQNRKRNAKSYIWREARPPYWFLNCYV